MAGTYQLPNPNSPATSDALTSLPIRQNFQSVQSQINNADGSALQAKSVSEAALADSINPRLMATNAGVSYVVSGFVTSVPAALSLIIPGGIAYVNGYYVNSAGSILNLPASKDNYVDISTNGTFTVVSVANGATTGMTLTVNSLRLMKVVTGVSAGTSIIQDGSLDSLGYLIFNRSPQFRIRKLQSGSFANFTLITSTLSPGSIITAVLPSACRALCRVGGIVNSNVSGVALDWHSRLDAGSVLNPVGAAASYFYAAAQNIPVYIIYDFGILAAGSHTLQIEVQSEGAGTFGGILSYDYEFIQA